MKKSNVEGIVGLLQSEQQDALQCYGLNFFPKLRILYGLRNSITLILSQQVKEEMEGKNFQLSRKSHHTGHLSPLE